MTQRLRQGELPFTKRGRRLDRRARAINVRAFFCYHKDKPNEGTVYKASDSAQARRDYWDALKLAVAGIKFTDIRAKRAPDEDP